jgi:hypothetical protein
MGNYIHEQVAGVMQEIVAWPDDAIRYLAVEVEQLMRQRGLTLFRGAETERKQVPQRESTVYDDVDGRRRAGDQDKARDHRRHRTSLRGRSSPTKKEPRDVSPPRRDSSPSRHYFSRRTPDTDTRLMLSRSSPFLPPGSLPPLHPSSRSASPAIAPSMGTQHVATATRDSGPSDGPSATRPRLLLFLIRGPSGSGKTTMAHELCARYGGGVAVSADDYFIDAAGKYRFDPQQLPTAHAHAQVACRNSTLARISPIAVHNTMAQCWEAYPYVKAGVDMGYEIHVMEPSTPWSKDPNELFKRNVHGIYVWSIPFPTPPRIMCMSMSFTTLTCDVGIKK